MKKVTKERSLHIAMIAPPWLKIPVRGYGGVENVIEPLSRELVKMGHTVELFAVKGSRIPGVKVHGVTDQEEYDNLLKPMYDFGLPAPCAHVLESLKSIRLDGTFDIIHDHSYFIGPTTLVYAAGRDGIPPALHTIHGPPPTPMEKVKEGVTDSRHFWRAVAGDHDLSLVSISDAMRHMMPIELERKRNLLDTVYNAIEVSEFPYVEQKKNYFLTLGNISPEKNQGLAARVCARKRRKLRMAGPVVDIQTPKRILAELANPLTKYRSERNFKYYSDTILPIVLKSPYVKYVGSIAGKTKLKYLSEAKALLHPIAWDEPFGMVVIEAMACGTPVIAMNHGAMAEIIKPGYNGFLANSEEEFASYLDRVDEIDPANCRRTVEEMFSAHRMASTYVDRYREVIEKAAHRK